MKPRFSFSLLPLLALAAAPASSPVTRPGPERWENDIQRFEAADHKKMPVPGGLLFVGSSTIAYWKTAAAFPEYPNVINRGFGGSEMIDSATYASRIITPYQPRVIVLYAGDNDLAAGTTPAAVDASFHKLCDTVHTACPQAKLIIVSAKVSNARLNIRGRIEALNQLFAADAQASGGWITYFDLVPLLLKDDGRPDPSLLRPDGLHMGDAGYAKVNEKLRPVLAELMK